MSRTGTAGLLPGAATAAVLAAAVALVGAWHLTQGTSDVGPAELLRHLAGLPVGERAVTVADVLLASRLPRLAAGIAVGIALGVAGALLQSVSRNPLASPDTLAVTAGSAFALAAVAAFGLAVPLWASGAVAVIGGLLAAGLVLLLAGSAGASTTRLILAGSAVAMALQAGTSLLLILFEAETTGLYAWGNGSLSQLSLDASLRALPVIALVVLGALLLARRLDLIGLGDDAASTLGVPVARTRVLAVLCAVLLTAVSVTLAGPLAFVGLGAPVLARLVGALVPSVHRHLVLLPVSGLLGALIVLLADATLRAVLTPQGAAAIPTGIPTALLGAVLIVLLARRLPETGATAQPPRARTGLRTRRRFLLVLAVLAAACGTVAVLGLLAGSLWLRTGDLVLWVQGGAPELIARALGERLPRVTAAILAGAALALAGGMVQSTVRNPLAEPGLLGITAGAGLGAAAVVTTLGGGRSAMVLCAVLLGLGTFAAIAALAWRGGLAPERFVLVGIGMGYAMSSLTAFLLLSANPFDTPTLLTWLSGTTYGRGLRDVIPVLCTLVLLTPLLLGLHRELDLLAVDEDTPRVLGVRLERTRLLVMALAAVLASVSVVAVGVVGFVGLVAPHLARALVGGRHARALPVAMLLGGVLVGLADALGRSVIAPAQIPAGLVVAVLGAPYFVWLLRRSGA
ncbi:iron ABC transporter permease [Brachybacterium saurashtrense]|uniref:Iron ABC transporter permease n=1 Tax=Brachybacterium saurashtrense TaxID=556288 RepID=A0A345YK31_9MICO|nr:iron ABC transporter permease [Brachybacterium saurashtrense]AXK44283.1 iron ABC transporter permease [Brachybacterium saurashtrense]RRR21319.1 iron ABC transporter permease [Brachybacterium saurashtrense]RRR22894.1 iron ABC transporter permease [Brachybacterium saurashtrense]